MRCAKKNAEFEVVLQSPKGRFDSADFTIIEALRSLPERSIVISMASKRIGNLGNLAKSFRRFCKSRGHKFISASTGFVHVSKIHEFIKAIDTDYEKLREEGKRVAQILTKGCILKVESKGGTDIRVDITDMKARINTGDYREYGSGGNLPTGEVYIAPRGTGNVDGVLVIDGSLKTSEATIIPKTPVKLYIEKGRITKLEGEEAHLLENSFKQAEAIAKYPERIRLICEAGVGINPDAEIIGSTVLDEKVKGTGHIAMGSNYWFGGPIRTIFHADQVFKDASFYVDGENLF